MNNSLIATRLPIWASCLWLCVLGIVWLVSQISFVFTFEIVCRGIYRPLGKEQFINEAGVLFCIGWAVLLPLLLWLILRLHEVGRFREYLGFSRPAGKELFHGLALVLLCGGTMDLIYSYLGIPLLTSWQIDTFRGFTGWWVIPLLVTVVLAAPFWEELLFRGFLFRSWYAGRKIVAIIGGIVIPAAFWTELHHGQYAWVYLPPIFVLGLLLGFCRRAGYSLWTCIAMHALNNAVSCAMTFFALAR